MEWNRDQYLISTDVESLDIPLIHDFLSNKAYWCRGIPYEIVERSIENSLCFGLFFNNIQVGFARLITDKATFAYLADVFILPEHRGRNLSKWMMRCILDHPSLQGLRRITLATADAHGLYSQFGFRSLNKPDHFMEIHYPDIY
ncbi:GNAT family N-acetyltransferase [Sansalvadorimonas sp. 2012CJ34-2]|uniref:GNAT family N-acetyltransferase n=1 Tax=Parendozoicomonas callyspongiae TaxID=2942213 RepID=A0ABT0PDA2_9GAMM|nr:GNAT family N-acetyltransferase [Sansalvadorimonas sp. 2012CJ34-2]MCL6269358.1 GNAT family N-acetyltransferase [Sansalvadorimonas sp. 2012CJ34-2]